MCKYHQLWEPLAAVFCLCMWCLRWVRHNHKDRWHITHPWLDMGSELATDWKGRGRKAGGRQNKFIYIYIYITYYTFILYILYIYTHLFCCNVQNCFVLSCVCNHGMDMLPGWLEDCMNVMLYCISLNRFLCLCLYLSHIYNMRYTHMWMASDSVLIRVSKKVENQTYHKYQQLSVHIMNV